jgi:hypothetical protein
VKPVVLGDIIVDISGYDKAIEELRSRTNPSTL